MKTVVIPVVVGALGTVKKGMVENIKKVSERATMTEIQKICILGSARILRKVLSVWTEWLTWVTDALGAWFAPGWCTKRTPAKTVIIETIIIIITLRTVISFVCSLCQSRKLKSWTFRHSYYFAVVHWGLTSLFKWSLWKTALSSLFISRVFIFTFQFICYFMQIPLKSWTAVTVRVNVWKLLTSRH